MKTSLTGMVMTFIMFTFLFGAFSLSYVMVNPSYDLTGYDNSTFEKLGNTTLLGTYINDTGVSTDANTKGDSSAFDVIGTLITTILVPYNLLKNGAMFLIGNMGDLISILGIPKLVSDILASLLTVIIISITIFAVILGRRDKVD